MNLDIRPLRPGDESVLQSLLDAPELAAHYDAYQGEGGVARLLGDPYIPRAGVRLAFVEGAPVGFACAVLLPTERPWAMLRGGVLEAFQRRGFGQALFEQAETFVRSQTIVSGITELAIAGYEPLAALRALAERRGYRHERWFWLMERPRGERMPKVTWPSGVSVRPLDGGAAMLADWNDAYNASFAGHYRFVPSPLDHVHELAAAPGFRNDGVLLAYRDGHVAGFCRNERHATRGEIATVGTVPAARGIGLGRALLRFGIDWLEREARGPVTLLVDGENEHALGLYRSEGFAVTRTRGIWSRSEAAR